MRIVPALARKCFLWRDPELAPWLLGYEVLRDVEAYWSNEVEKGRGVRGRLVRIYRWGGYEFYTHSFFFRTSCPYIIFLLFLSIFYPLVHFDCNIDTVRHK